MSQQKTYSIDDIFLPAFTGEPSQYSVRNALNNPDMLPAAEIGKRDQAAEVMGTTYGEADAGWDDVSTEMQIRKAESVPNADKWVAESQENASFLDADADALMAVYDDLQAQGFLTEHDIDRSTMRDVASSGPSGLEDTLERGRLANQRTDIGLAYREGRISADEARFQLSSIDDRLAVLSERRSDPLGFYGFVEQGYRMLTRDLPQAGYRALEGGLVGASAGAAAGATLGTAVPVVGNLVGAGGGALGGAFGGAAAGLARGMFESSRDMEEANFLADMLIQKDDAGQYLDEESVRNAAMLYGNLSALVEVGGDALSVAVLKYVSPAVKTAMAKLGVQSPKLFVKDAVKTALSNKSAWPALRRFVVGMGLGAAAEGAEEAVQEGISGQIEATTKNWLADLGVNYFREEQKGLLSGDTWAQMVEAGIEGAKVGAWFVLLPGVTQLAVDSARVSRAREFASSVEKVTDTINATQTKQLSPVRMESFLKAQGLNQTVFIPADAAWQMQREGVDIAAPLGWEQQTLEEAAALGHDIAVPLARLEARLDADAMKRVAQILKEGPDSPNAMQAQEPNLYLADDVEAINEAAAEWEFEQNILSHDIERLRSMLTEAVRSVPGLLKDLTSSSDTETSVGSYVDSIVKLVENAEQRLAAYGGQTGSVISDFMNRLQIQGLVRDEKGRARTPEEMERAAVEEAQAQADAPFWENVWGRLDAASLKRDFPEARKELASIHGRGLFAPRKGEGVPVDQLADELKTAGWLPEDADSSTLIEILKEKRRPTRRNGRRGVRLNQAMAQSQADSLEGFVEEAREGQITFWRSSRTPDALKKILNSDDIVINIPYSFVRHLDNRRREQTDRIVKQVEDVLSSADYVVRTGEKKGKPLYSAVKANGDGTSTLIVFEHNKGRRGNRVLPYSGIIENSEAIDAVVRQKERASTSTGAGGNSSSPKSLSENEVRVLEALTEDSMPESAAESNTLFQTAYHGTPHRFDEFSLEHIGEGEGAQAHGWGLYFAADKKVSDDYRNRLRRGRSRGQLFEVDIPDDDVLLDEQKIFAEQPEAVKSALRSIYKSFSKEQLAPVREGMKAQVRRDKDLEKRGEELTKKSQRLFNQRRALKTVNAQRPKGEGNPFSKEGSAKLFELGEKYLHEMYSNAQIERLQNDADYLNAEKAAVEKKIAELEQKIAENEQRIETKRAKERESIDKARLDTLLSRMNGSDLYSGISIVLDSPKAASEALNAAGIKGITYDGQQDGRAFVVFDDKAIRILNTFYQFLGAQGISRLDLADEVNVRMDNLAVARSMDRAGKDARVIKEATGWERGADGKWRYEVGDVILSKAWFERNLKTDDSGSGSFSGTLADVVPSELLTAYPALKDVPVTIRISPSSGRAGAYSSDGIEISAPSSRDVNSLLNHEIQHAIQEQEGFARGGSPEEMRDMAVAQVQERLAGLERGDDIRMLMEMEDDTFFDEVPAELRPIFEAKLEELRQTITPDEVAQYRELAAGMDYESVSEAAFDLYRQLMGEVEARNVQTRMGMTMEERLASLASETEDVAREDQIFLEHAARAAMMAQDEAGMAAGRITTLESGEYAIQLFRGANLSTVAHEISHAVHMEMERIEAEGRATPALQRDLDALRRWTSRMDDNANLKAEYDKYQKGLYGGMAFEELDDLALLVVRRTAKQEMIARGFEAYLREGVAPSAQMEGVFRRFKKWLMRVYRQAVMLDVELNDEVREVFDRIVASDEDIEAAAAARSVRDESAGILDALGVKGADRLTMEGLIADAKDKAADALRRDRARNRRDNVKQWRDEVERELDNDPVYRARKAMRRTPIDLDAVVETYGQEMADKLRAKLPAAMKRGGDNPELLAFDYGFQNAGEMIQAILNRPGLAERRSELMAQKRADADARFAAEDYLFEQEELAEQQDKIGEIVYRLEMSGRTQGGQLVQGDTFIERWKVAREQLKTVAEQYLDKQTAAEAVRPDLYRTAAARFMREERYAILSKDWAAALQANYRARLNIEIAKQAADRRDMVEKLTSRAKRFLDSPLPDKGARFAVFVLSQQTRLFNPTRKMIQNAADKGLDDIRSFLDDMKEQGYYTVDAEIPESLFTSSPAAWRSMPWNELRPYLEAMAVTMHMEQKARKANSEAARESWRNEMDGIANSILSLNPHREKGPLDKQNIILKKLKEVHASHLKADTICRLLDGDAEFGPAWSAIIQPINRATADRDRRLRAAQKQVRKLFGVYSAREWVDIRGNRIFVQALGKAITKEQMLAMTLNSGNESNKQRLMDGMGLTETQVQAVIDMLDERDVKFVQAVWDYLETFRKESFDLEESLTGVRPQAIEATPVQTRFGALRGGYYPVVYDSEASSKPIDTDSIGTLTGSMMPAVDHGSMKQRTANGLGTALQLDLEAVPRHVVKTIHMLAFRKPVQQVARVLNDKAVNAAIESTAGVAQSKALKSWLHYVAGERPGRNGWSRVLGQLRKNAALYTMGLKLTTILAQLTGLLSSVAEIGPRWVLSGIVNTYAVRNPFQVYRETAALSEVMANRMRSVDRDLYEMSTGLMERGSSNRILDPFVRFKNWQERNAFLPMGFVQMAFADLPTWQGAYHKALHDGMSQERAIQYADSVVERTQVGGADKDLAGVQRGEELGKIMTQFYSYFSALYQLYARRITMVKRRHSAADIGRLATLFLLTGVLEPVLSALVTRDSPDDDDDMEDWLAWAGRKIFFNPWNMVIGLRDITGAIESRMEGYGGKARVGSLLNDVIDSGIRFTSQLEKGMDMDARKVFDSGWKLAGLATGQVNAQELLIIDELWDWLDGSNPDFELADLIRKKK